MPYDIRQISPYIREVGIQGNDEWSRPRRLYDHQFFYCFRGEGEILIDERSYRLQPGALVLIEPDTPHSYQRSRHSPCDCYWFHCDFFYRDDLDWPQRYYNNPADYLELFGARLLYPEHIRERSSFAPPCEIPRYLLIEQQDQMRYHFENIYASFSNGSAFAKTAALAHFYSILELIFIQNNHETRHSIKVITQLNHMKNFIKENYFRKISVREIARVTVYNADYAGKLFKQEYGQSVNEYLTDFRINKAKRLLLDLDLTIADVAYMTGFNNESYFSSVIKASEGVSPSQLRDRILTMLDDISS